MKIFIVDSFTRDSFKGNPAGVFMVTKKVTDDFLQNVATEMNFSETAFVTAKSDKTFQIEKHFNLRWFTPEVEVNLCGHATLAAAKVIYEYYKNMNEILCFDTKSGLICCYKNSDKIEMKFPINKGEELNEIISFNMCSNLKNEEILSCVYSKETKKLLVEINSYDKLKGLLFDYNKLRGMIFPEVVKGLIITTGGDEKYDFYSRYFAPWVGINEDPVTGSSHTLLYPYWNEKLKKDKLVSKQISKRSGEIELFKRDDCVVLVGEAKIIMAGKFMGDIF